MLMNAFDEASAGSSHLLAYILFTFNDAQIFYFPFQINTVLDSIMRFSYFAHNHFHNTAVFSPSPLLVLFL